MTYFLSFDYWTTTQNRYWSGIVDEDLTKTSLQQICRDVIDSKKHEEHKDTWAVKVLSFNNISIKE